jgi:hypothetical protein
MLTILHLTGRNRHGQRLCKASCACGAEFETIHNNVLRGRTKSCGHCGKPAKEPKQKPTQKVTSEIKQDCASAFERGSVAWFNDQIESKERAALAAEVRVKELQAAMADSESTDLDLLKRWNAESTAFEKLNRQIARLQTARDKAEASVHKDERSLAEVNRDKIAALRGRK